MLDIILLIFIIIIIFYFILIGEQQKIFLEKTNVAIIEQPYLISFDRLYNLYYNPFYYYYNSQNVNTHIKNSHNIKNHNNIKNSHNIKNLTNITNHNKKIK